MLKLEVTSFAYSEIGKALAGAYNSRLVIEAAKEFCARLNESRSIFETIARVRQEYREI